MNCKEFEKTVPDFMNKKMDFIKMKRFLEHLRKCPNCKEELNIQFLIDEGLARLEEGGPFDLQKEIAELVKEADKKVRTHEKYMRVGQIIEGFCVLLVLAVVFLIIFM